MRRRGIYWLLLLPFSVSGQYSPPTGEAGSIAVHKDSSVIVGWANRVQSFDPGPQNINDSGSPLANFGIPSFATGHAEGTSVDVVSLGDGGSIVLGFNYPIMNGSGPDFAVFENGFDDVFLEFAHVEVSTDGETFVRIPSVCLVQDTLQTSGFGSSNTELVHNLAGKFRQGYGTPFDLEDIVDSAGINLDSINYVKLIDVVGSIQGVYSSYDAEGHVINDPFPTAFESGGFDLDAVGVIHANGTFVAGLNGKAQPEIKIFPNPTTDYLTIESKVPFVASLFTLSGELLFTTDESTIHLRSSALTSGTYLLKVTGENETYYMRIVYLN